MRPVEEHSLRFSSTQEELDRFLARFKSESRETEGQAEGDRPTARKLLLIIYWMLRTKGFKRPAGQQIK
jgi:hypothetical protein